MTPKRRSDYETELAADSGRSFRSGTGGFLIVV